MFCGNQYRQVAYRDANSHWNKECTEEEKSVLEKFHVLKEAIAKFLKSNNYLSVPDVPPNNCGKDFWISYREKLAEYTESFIAKESVSSKINLYPISFVDRVLSISGCRIINYLLISILEGAINKETLRINRMDVVKPVLLKLSSIYKAEKGEDYWKDSVERTYINSLYTNIQDFEPFDINSIDDLELKSVAAFLLKGEDYEALTRYLQDNNFSDYSLVLTLWGASEGYASLHKGLVVQMITP